MKSEVYFSTSHSLINRPFRSSSTTVSGTEIIRSDSGTGYTGNYGLNADWTLYKGGENRKNTLDVSKAELERGRELFDAGSISKADLAQLQSQASSDNYDLVSARAGFLPSLSLSAGIGTNHTSGTDFTFTEQIKNGWNVSVRKQAVALLYCQHPDHCRAVDCHAALEHGRPARASGRTSACGRRT